MSENEKLVRDMLLALFLTHITKFMKGHPDTEEMIISLPFAPVQHKDVHDLANAHCHCQCCVSAQRLTPIPSAALGSGPHLNLSSQT